GVILNNSLDLDPVIAGDQKTFLVAGKGVFTANDDGTITFTPSGPTINGPISIKYTVADDKGAVSAPATLTLTDPVTTIPADAGADQVENTATQTASVTITANSPSGFSGLWKQKSGPTTVT